MEDSPVPPSLPPPIYRGPCPQFLAVVGGPVICWLSGGVGLVLYSVLAQVWPRHWPGWLHEDAGIILLVLYVPLSSAVCGTLASFFMHGRSHPDMPLLDVDWVTRYLFLLPFGFNPFFWCPAFFIVPIYNVCFDAAFNFAFTCWASGSWRRWLGDSR